MPNYLDIFNVDGDKKSSEFKENINNNCLRSVSQAKQLKSKHKCKKALKRKLKKYKLRRNGEEDKDVIDVSQSFKVALNIKSPNKPVIVDFIRPDNYLIKMVKRKQLLKNNKCNLDSVESSANAEPTNISSSKKQTNAFQLLMDGRNKSIGCNSPGKERTEDDSQASELTEQRNNKAKRMLVLQKMADAKGALKRKEKEDIEDQCIKQRMEIRAEKLKAMITKPPLKKIIDNTDKTLDEVEKISTGLRKDNKDSPQMSKDTKIKSFSIIDMFDNIEDNVMTSPNKKQLLKEDEEFLKKLSPSIKKKENMLSYFQKVDKDSDLKKDEHVEENNGHSIIKVKFSAKRKSKKKSKLKLIGDLKPEDHCKTSQTAVEIPVQIISDVETYTELNIVNDNTHISEEEVLNTSKSSAVNHQDSSSTDFKHKSKKELRKHKHNVNKTISMDVMVDDSRPKRTVRKLVKLISDDEKDTEVNTVNDNIHNKSVEVVLNTAKNSAFDHNNTSFKDIKHEPKKKLRKRKHNVGNKTVSMEVDLDDSRPKRTVRKPIKYYDDAFLTSSDEELHTPKKPKKQMESDNSTKSKDKTSCLPDIPKSAKKNILGKNLKTSKLKEVKEEAQLKKPLKLAPIFNNKVLTAEEIKAKQDFLQSGVPEQLKKIIVPNRINENISSMFHVTVHVQQYSKEKFVPLLYTIIDAVFDEVQIPHGSLNSILNLDLKESKLTPTFTKCSVKEMLHSIKESYPKFPVFRTYHTLRSKSKGDLKDWTNVDFDNSVEVINNIPDIKNESPDKLMWTDKYKPLTTSQIIGNFESVKELRKWLVTWTENNDNFKSSSGYNSDSSDFYMSENDSKDGIKPSKNLLVITGPIGSGKTSAVYAVAAELAIKVIEVNASSKRTGKIMLQDLQEATQSHKVNRGKGCSQDNSQKSLSQDIFESQSKIVKKKGRKKKDKDTLKTKTFLSQEVTSSQDSTRTCMSLILIDDADIVFEQDDGFCSAISQLVQCSKRPVILITQSMSCPHLQRFLQGNKIIKTSSLLPRMLGTWLDIMCLADNGTCLPGMGAKILDHFKGDIRKTINYLQYYMSTKESTKDTLMSQDSDVFNPNIEDESSSMSWIDKDHIDEKVNVENKIRLQFLNDNLSLPLDEFDVWWSLPNLYKVNSKSSTDLNLVANALDSFSVCDYLGKSTSTSRLDISCNPWDTTVTDSVIETENMDDYDENSSISKDICSELVKSSVLQLRRISTDNIEMELHPPTMIEYRKREKIIHRHNSLTSFLSQSAILDRRALALDYWPSCRSICRTEKNKLDNNSRRNNRFCHYLKTQNVSCRSEFFDELCDSLQTSLDSL